MQVSKKEGKLLDNAIDSWRDTEVVSELEADKLKGTYEITAFDWKRVAKYSFWLAISCILISVSSILADEWIIALFKRLFYAPDSVKCVVFALLSGLLYLFGVRRKRRTPHKVYSNEAVLFLGAVATAVSIVFLGEAVGTNSNHFSLLILLAAIVYGFLGLWFPSKLVWLLALLTLGGWFGAETGYASGWGAYYLGMNYPLRFVVFGAVLLLFGSYTLSKWQARNDLLAMTKVVGLLYVFVALWLMSMLGNYGDGDVWQKVQPIELIHWSLLLAAVAIGMTYHGVKFNDVITRGFGITFIFINIYTRFFEYFWGGMHKAVFFTLLALSFWYLGTKAEQIWHLSLVKGFKKASENK